MAKRSSISPLHIGVLWAASLGLYLAARATLQAFFGLPLMGPGILALGAVLLAVSWALVEEPGLEPGAASLLVRAWTGVALLVLGEAGLYYFVEGKERLAPFAFACFGAAALAFLAPPGRRLEPLKLGLAALIVALCGLSVWAWLRPSDAGMDLIAGPLLGRGGPVFAWILGALGFAGVLALAHFAAPVTAPQPALPWRKEALGLLAVLALGAAIRFPQMGAVPDGIWYDELNLSRATEDRVLREGAAPLYVAEQVENPGAYLWVGAAVYKVFGVGITPLRYLAAIFGLLALIPFWGLARLWFGARWALAATALFAVMRWTLIPQRIAFMSGFALFWMLAALWAFWSARLRPSAGSGLAWRWVLAGALAGCNLHTYTPGRLVPMVIAAFIALDLAFELRTWRFRSQGAAQMAAGFLVTAGPMLWYIATHWAVYSLRASQVSIFTDAAKSGRPLFGELWTTFSKHVLMFNLRGDFNARHNLHFYPHVDLLTASALALSLPYALGRFFKDARGRFITLWFGAMLCAGIFTLSVEAPQGHRTILAAPALALAIIWAVRDLLGPVGKAFTGGWPKAGLAAALALLLSVAAFNAYEVFGIWGPNSETWRSFSPFATAIARRVTQAPPNTVICVSNLPQEYQFHGYESMVFAQYFLRAQQRQPQPFKLGTHLIDPQGSPPSTVLAVWGESDADLTLAMAAQFPGITVEKPANPHPVAGEPSVLYLAAEIPWDRIPAVKGLKMPFALARDTQP